MGRIRSAIVYISPFLLAVAVLAVLVTSVSTITRATDTQRRLVAIAETNRANGLILVDCTTASPVPPPSAGEPDLRRPGDVHPCYERGQVGQAAAIGSINCVTLWATGHAGRPGCEATDRALAGP